MKKLSALFVLIIFLSGSLACQISGGPKPPRLLSITRENASGLEKALSNPQSNPQTGTIKVTITEEQLSSYVNYNLPPDLAPYINYPLFFFEPNEVHVYATYVGESFQADGRIRMALTVMDHKPKFNLISAEFGPIPIPSFFLNTLTEQLDREISKILETASIDYQLDQVTVSTGTLTADLSKK